MMRRLPGRAEIRSLGRSLGPGWDPWLEVRVRRRAWGPGNGEGEDSNQEVRSRIQEVRIANPGLLI